MQTLSIRIFALLSAFLALGLIPAVSADAFRPAPRDPLGVRDRLGLKVLEPLDKKDKESSGTFTNYEETGKRFTLMYEVGLEKKEPASMTMAEAREAIGRVEAKLGAFKEKFALVVVTELGGTKDPFTTTGRVGKTPAVLVTFNGTLTPVLAHGMGMRRLEELKTKAPVWLRNGGSRIFSSVDGFDPTLYKVLDDADGPLAYTDADKTIEDEKASHEEKLRALATGWALTYYCSELSPKRIKIEEVMNLPDRDRPNTAKVWKAIKDKRKKEEKQGD